MLVIVKEVKIFEYELGRKFYCFLNILKSLLDKLDVVFFYRWFINNKGKFFVGVNDFEEIVDDEDDD